MFNKRILLAIITGLLIAFSFTPALAQTSGAVEIKKRIAEQIASGASAQAIEKTESDSLPVPATARQAAGASNGIIDILDRQKNALLGCWDLTLTFSDGSQAKSTLSVFPGRADGEGTVIHAAEASLLLPNPTTPEQGAWAHNGGLQFIASYKGFAVDDKFQAPFGTVGFRQLITMNSDQQTFTGRATFEVAESSGNVVFSDTIQIQGTRQRAIAPKL